MTRTHLILHGGRGRMGHAIADVASERDDLIIAHVVGRGDPFPEQVSPGTVLVDFSTASAVLPAAAWCAMHGIPLVCGTTALDPAAHASLDDAARRIAVVQASNMSVGVAVLARLVRDAVAALGPEFEIEVIEAHHRAKIDAPSGTALTLAKAARDARGGGELHPGRTGITGARERSEIGISSVRGGSIVGDHTVMLLGPHERLELVHRADDRSIFARGAVRAARWISTQPAGRYTMTDVLGDPT